MSTGDRCYRAFGLSFRSCFAWPGFATEGGGRAQVVVRSTNEVVEPVSDELFHHEHGLRKDVLHVRGVGRYVVRQGREVIVSRERNGSESELVLFLLGSALSFLLRQRGYLVLHGSAVAGAHGGLVFLGHSGMGKSTTSASFVHGGCELIADDLTAISLPRQAPPVLQAGCPHIKLAPEVLALLGEPVSQLDRVHHRVEKYRWLPSRRRTRPTPVSRIYLLDYDDVATPQVRRLSYFEQVSALMEFAYRPAFLEPVARRLEHFRQSGQLLASTRVKRLVLPRDSFHPDRLIPVIEQDLRASTQIPASVPLVATKST